MDLVKLREALLISSGASDALKNWENVSFLWALKDMQIVARMADQAGLSMPIAGAIKELVKDGRRIKTDQSAGLDGTRRETEALESDPSEVESMPVLLAPFILSHGERTPRQARRLRGYGAASR